MNLLEEALYLIRHEKISANSYCVHLTSFVVLHIFMVVFHEHCTSFPFLYTNKTSLALRSYLDLKSVPIHCYLAFLNYLFHF